MKYILKTLQRIEQEVNALGNKMRQEQQILKAELEERLELGLQGDAAIKHYNEWMQHYGMVHMTIEEL